MNVVQSKPVRDGLQQIDGQEALEKKNEKHARGIGVRTYSQQLSLRNTVQLLYIRPLS